jgi:hypothetical protein
MVVVLAQFTAALSARKLGQLRIESFYLLGFLVTTAVSRLGNKASR